MSVLPFSEPKSRHYAELYQQASALLSDERDLIANAANLAAFLFHSLEDINWAGFYLAHGQTLVLGPFQGKPACTRIEFGKGVCGTAAQTGETIVVPDVRAFAGHIACDPNSRSEIVVPLVNWGKLLGVLDLDSPQPSRFDETDREGLESLCALFLSRSLIEMPDLGAESASIETASLR